MTLPLCAFGPAIRRFFRATDGTISVETAFVMPLLCWLYVASFVWFDAYRTQNVNLKATYTISDMISREQDRIDQTYFEGLASIYGYLTRYKFPTQLRVSTIECTANCDSDAARTLDVCWSAGSNGRAQMTAGDLAGLAGVVPLFAEGDTLIVTETFMRYTPAFNVGLDQKTFENIVFTRPRLTGQVKFGTDDGDLHCFQN